MVTCPSCRSTVVPGAFCGDCGRPLRPVPGPVAPYAVGVPAGRGAYAAVGGPAPVGPPPAFDRFPAAGPPLPPGPPFPPGHPVGPPMPYSPGHASGAAPLSLGRPRWLPGAAVAAVVVALAAAGYAASSGAEQHTLTGQLSLYDSDYSGSTGSSCSGSGGYDDIGSGTQVIVTDASGTTIATDSLSSGTYDGTSCVFTFTVRDVPRATYYRVRAGSDTRGGPQYSYDEMRQQHWSVQLSLGDD